MKPLPEETKPFAFKKTEKEETTHKPHEHAWPKRKSKLPYFLVLALVLIFAYGFLTNSFEGQYARLENATMEFSENGGTIPLSADKRMAFRNAIEEIQPVPLLNNGDIVKHFVEARLAFMDAQDELNKRFESPTCTSTVKDALQNAQQKIKNARTAQEAAITRLASEPPKREVTFMSMILAFELIVEEEIQNCLSG